MNEKGMKMTEIYCGVCGAKLEIVGMPVLSSSIEAFTVKPCPNCSNNSSSWRSVKDDPPPFEMQVIACWNSGEVRPCRRSLGRTGVIAYYGAGDILTFKEPDWWMPFPKAKGVK